MSDNRYNMRPLKIVQDYLLAQSARHWSRSCSTSASSSFCLAWQPPSISSRCSRPLFSLIVNSLSRSAASLRLCSIAIWLLRFLIKCWRAAFSSSGSWRLARSLKESRCDQSPSTCRLSWYLSQNIDKGVMDHSLSLTAFESPHGCCVTLIIF